MANKDGGWTYLSVGLEWAITILLCLFIGNYVDRKWDTSPWGVVLGSLIGIVAGFYNLWMVLKRNDP